MKFKYLFFILLSSCSATYKTQIDFNPQEPIRVAVLPFVAKDASGRIVEQEGRLLIDNVGLVSTEVEENPVQTVRKLTISELKKTSLDLVSSALIDIDLPHHGYARADGTLDLTKVWQEKPSVLCGGFLSCDAILYGTITKWDRSYYGIQSVNSVGIELSLVSAKDGKILFTSKGEDSESRGITKIPTGISDVFLEPIKGLDSEIIANLSRTVIKKMLDPLIIANRPSFIDNSPPSIFASSHDGAGRKISEKNPMIVVMYASENAKASFRIGDIIDSIPMVERSPGHYYGEYIPLKTDNFKSETVTVSVTDSVGRKTISETPGGEISFP